MTPLIQELRQATASAHARLENDLGLLTEPLSRSRFIHVLGRFHGFHQQWEPAMATALNDPAFFEPRRRLPQLAADLRHLGVDPAPLPIMEGAAALAQSPGGLGSLYVMEGSTLGGQVISRALAGADWAPENGLAYFQPYGPQTGAMWRAFADYAERRTASDARPAVIARAIETFDALRAWLTR